MSEPCIECGMICEPGEYHPYAACLMFKGCHNSTIVTANLNAVVAKGAQYDSGFDDMADRIRALAADLAECQRMRDSWKRIAESGVGITSETMGDTHGRS